MDEREGGGELDLLSYLYLQVISTRSFPCHQFPPTSSLLQSFCLFPFVTILQYKLFLSSALYYKLCLLGFSLTNSSLLQALSYKLYLFLRFSSVLQVSPLVSDSCKLFLRLHSHVISSLLQAFSYKLSLSPSLPPYQFCITSSFFGFSFILQAFPIFTISFMIFPSYKLFPLHQFPSYKLPLPLSFLCCPFQYYQYGNSFPNKLSQNDLNVSSCLIRVA